MNFLVFLLLLVAGFGIFQSEAFSTSSSLLDRVRHATVTSTRSASNITAAFEATRQWEEILNDKTKSALGFLTNEVQAICFALYASCLVRIGKDDEAIAVYDEALKLEGYLNQRSKEDVNLGKAQALQRLLQYENAQKQFLQSLSERSVSGAALCAMRLGNINDAIDILQDYYERTNDASIEIVNMLGILLYVSEPGSQARQQDAMEKLVSSKAVQSSLLYRWIYFVLLIQHTKKTALSCLPISEQCSFLDLIKINQSPFDDPMLIQLDDKVNLHNLLVRADTALLSRQITSNPSAFWPEGIILPTERECLISLCEEGSGDEEGNGNSDSFHNSRILWICKQRAGYGSHGNQIVTLPQVIEMMSTTDSNSEIEECLLQRMIEPPLLLEGRKFSLRIYVVYIGSIQHVYLSREGLVKLAALPIEMDQDDHKAEIYLDDRLHMTNSGRELDMIQKDLQYLEGQFLKSGWSYDDLWEGINSAVAAVMRIYDMQKHMSENSTSIKNMIASGGNKLFPNETSQSEEGTSILGIPKIMGFDFVVDASRRPWLIEVNRFPGLEPRDSTDRRVKYKVVKLAWMCAAQRLGASTNYRDHPLGTILKSLECDDDHDDDVDITSSLQRVFK